ncbi:hypothetical protein SBBP2_630029 [Burkholderiales bacterium]|nr:hypothetical protein SBBP2_630029 [Burkholderiales bacterium]
MDFQQASWIRGRVQSRQLRPTVHTCAAHAVARFTSGFYSPQTLGRERPVGLDLKRFENSPVAVGQWTANSCRTAS